MFGFKKKENKPLLIMGTEVIEIIKSDYEEDMAFALIEFLYDGKQYTIGSCVLPANAEECKENISFVFQDRVFKKFDEFQSAVFIDGKHISQLDKPIEVIRAGIIDHEALLKSPWGDRRLVDKAINK